METITTTKEIYLRADGTTCPLTCSKCGEVIERGAALSWNRLGEKKFWHTGDCGAVEAVKPVARKAPRKFKPRKKLANVLAKARKCASCSKPITLDEAIRTDDGALYHLGCYR